MKTFLTATVVAFSTFTAAQALDTKPFLESSAFIEWSGGRASGFFTDPTHVVTARHVVDSFQGEHGVYVFDYQGNRHRVRDTVLSYDADVAMVEIDNPTPNQPVAVVSCRMPEVLETLMAVGNPLTLRNVVSPVMVVATNDERDLDDVISLSIVGGVGPGMSGGPVYDSNGKVVGVLSSILAHQPEGSENFVPSSFAMFVPAVAVPELCIPEAPERTPTEGSPAEEGLSSPGSGESN